MRALPVPREIIEIEDDSSDEDDAWRHFVTLDDNDAFTYLPEANTDVETPPFNAALPSAPVSPSLGSPYLPITDPEVLYLLYFEKVLEVFPDICHEHVRLLYNARTRAFGEQQSAAPEDDISQGVIMQILDTGKYPKEKDKKKELKRKRSFAPASNEEDTEWTAQDRPKPDNIYYGEDIRLILQKEFPNIPSKYIELKLKECKFLYQTYLALELAERTYDTRNPPYVKLKALRKAKSNAPSTMSPTGYGLAEIERELHAAKKKREQQEATRRKKQEVVDADIAFDRQCQESGDMVECQCCFTDTPIPKSTYCRGDDPHFFCFDCARSNAKSQTELSRYKLACMDGSGCQAEFSREQKHRFLDVKTINLLERLQQQDELRTADVADLEKCPFCDYAAICPPIEVDKEFRCSMPDCERVSCRLCKNDSHIPLSCEEYRKENGLTERHVLEEAMTSALIRPCPKCKVPILKEGGCNKLVCSRCRCCVCDFCGADITNSGYGHFSSGAANSKGCPPQDDTERRNATRIEAAEKEAMAKIRLENPTLNEDDLKIKFSKEVQKSDTRRHAHGFYDGLERAHFGNGAEAQQIYDHIERHNAHLAERLRGLREGAIARQLQVREAYQGIANAMPPVLPPERATPLRARRDMAAVGRAYERPAPSRTAPARAEEVNRAFEEIPHLRRATMRVGPYPSPRPKRPDYRQAQPLLGTPHQLVPPQRENTIQDPIGPLTGYPYNIDVFARDLHDGYGNGNRNGHGNRNVGTTPVPGAPPPYMGWGQQPDSGNEGWGDHANHWYPR